MTYFIAYIKAVCFLLSLFASFAVNAQHIVINDQYHNLNQRERQAILEITFNAAITQRAIQRQVAKEIHRLVQRIEELSVETVKRETRTRELLAVKQELMLELQGRDKLYSAQLKSFSDTLRGITETPQGIKILTLYHSGKEAEALDQLELLTQRRKHLREDAILTLQVADAREIAILALDSADRGKIPRAQLIGYFETLVTLDPEDWRSWLVLFRTYYSEALFSKAERAADRAVDITKRSNSYPANLFSVKAAGEASLRKMAEQHRASLAKIHEQQAVNFNKQGLSDSRTLRSEHISGTTLSEFHRYFLNYVILNEDEKAGRLYADVVVAESFHSLFHNNDTELADLTLSYNTDSRESLPSPGGVCELVLKLPETNSVDPIDRLRKILMGEVAVFGSLAFQETLRSVCQNYVETPESVPSMRNIAFVLERFALVALESNEPRLALILLRDAEVLDERLLTKFPDSMSLHRNLAVTRFHSARIINTRSTWIQAARDLDNLYQQNILGPADKVFVEYAANQSAALEAPITVKGTR